MIVDSKIGIKGDKFCLDNNLIPSNYMIVVAETGLQLWNFDERQERKKLSCHMQSSISFP